MRNRIELMKSTTNSNCIKVHGLAVPARIKLASYNNGYQFVKEQAALADKGVNREELEYIADKSNLASNAYYAGMLAALFPTRAYYLIG
jgi:hypothetical protein